MLWKPEQTESTTETVLAESQAEDSLWKPATHVPQLDGVRGLAILIVTLFRFSNQLPVETQAGWTLKHLFAFGDRGVELFFVLSGFLITGILLESKTKPHFFRNFFARRSLRIFPLYFAALFLFVVVSQWFTGTRDLFRQAADQQFFLWTYLTNVKMSVADQWCFGSLDHFWSLAVEEHFYLLWPFLIFWLSPRAGLKFSMVAAIVCAVARVAYAAVGDSGVAPNVLTIFRMDALLLGAIIAFVIRSPEGIRRWVRPARYALVACLIACIVASLTGKRLWTITHSIWPLLWGCGLVILLDSRRGTLLAKFFDLGPLRNLGKYSYAIYVFQSPLIPLMAMAFAWTGWTLSGAQGWQAWPICIGYIVGMFAVTYLAALASWHVIERHCLKLKRWF